MNNLDRTFILFAPARLKTFSMAGLSGWLELLEETGDGTDQLLARAALAQVRGTRDCLLDDKAANTRMIVQPLRIADVLQYLPEGFKGECVFVHPKVQVDTSTRLFWYELHLFKQDV